MQNIINELVERISEGKSYIDVLEKFEKEEKNYKVKKLIPMFEQAMENFVPEKVLSIAMVLIIIGNEKIEEAASLSDEIYHTMVEVDPLQFAEYERKLGH